MPDIYGRYYAAETEARDLSLRLGQFIPPNHLPAHISRELFKSAVSEVEEEGIRLLSQFSSYLYNSTNIVIFYIPRLSSSGGGALMILGETQDKVDDTARKLNLPLEILASN